MLGPETSRGQRHHGSVRPRLELRADRIGNLATASSEFEILHEGERLLRAALREHTASGPPGRVALRFERASPHRVLERRRGTILELDPTSRSEFQPFHPKGRPFGGPPGLEPACGAPEVPNGVDRSMDRPAGDETNELDLRNREIREFGRLETVTAHAGRPEAMSGESV